MKTLTAAAMRAQIDRLDKAITALGIVRPHVALGSVVPEDWMRVANAMAMVESVRETLMDAAIADVTIETDEAVVVEFPKRDRVAGAMQV